MSLSIRKQLVNKIINVVTTDDFNHMVLNINGVWGSGKTYVSKLVEEEVNKNNQCIVLRINISDYDYCNDPLVPFLTVILDYINSTDKLSGFDKEQILTIFITVINIIAWLSYFKDPSGTLKKILLGIGEKISGEDKKHNKYTSKHMVDMSLNNVKSYQNAITQLKVGISKFYELTDGKKIVIFVDDFDRANPQFSFKVLNIIYQLKDIEHLQICTIMNRVQLETQITHIYGKFNEHDEHYLTKYINLEITVENPCLDKHNVLQLLKELGIKHSYDSSYFNNLISKLSVRELNIFAKKHLLLLMYCDKDEFKIWQSKNANAYSSLLLLTIIFVRFEFKLSNLWYGLMSMSEIEQLVQDVIYSSNFFTGIDNAIANPVRNIFNSELLNKNRIDENQEQYKSYTNFQVENENEMIRFYKYLLTSYIS